MRRFIGDGRTRGPGGPRVLVLGGTGFVGRHAARALRDLGAAPIIGTRKAPRERTQLGDLVDDCAHRTLHLERLQSAADWGPELDGVDVVLNCVGILRPTGRATYDRVHHRAVAALAAACAGRDARLVHVSALGLDAPVRSRFLRSKRDGELALRASDADWYLVRPALLDGDGGYGAAWIRRVANWRVRCVPWNARGRLAPLDVRDLGLALARLCLAPPPVGPGPTSRIFELGGPAERTMAEHLDALRDPALPPAGAPWRIPGPLARLASHACDLLRWTPYSFGHHELMLRDNRPLPNRIEELIGRPPRQVRCVPEPVVPAPARGRRIGSAAGV